MGRTIYWCVFCCFLLLSGCSTSIPLEDRAAIRAQINQESIDLITKLSQLHPEITQQLASAEGYATANISRVKIPLVGKGNGLGAVYNIKKNATTYIDIHRYDVGAGLALGNYHALAIFNDKETLDKFTQGTSQYAFENEWNFGEDETAAHKIFSFDENEVPIYILYESNNSAISSARLVSVTVNDELTETGLGNARVPNKVVDKRETNPQWDRYLPLKAQDVIDKGYSLPKPLGVSILYADTYQYMSLTDLEVKLHGKPGNGQAIDFISFDNNYSHTKTPQLKFDAWLFPFMNVFATVGRLGGDVHVEFAFDRDNIGKPSTTSIAPERPSFPDKIALDLDLSGYSYTLGTILAVGWSDYFVTMPLSFTQVDMDRNDTDEKVFNASLRLGKQFQFEDARSISIFAGVGYTDSNLTITGVWEPDPEELDALEYTITQENIDKWVGLIGANYNFDRNWSVVMEYGQNDTGKRRQFVASINRRF